MPCACQAPCKLNLACNYPRIVSRLAIMDKLIIPRKEKTSKMISVRFTADEYAMLEAKARKASVPLATLVRASAVFLVEQNVSIN